MKRALSALAILLIVLIAACGNEGSPPDQAAKQWFEALANGDANGLQDLTCAAQQDSATGLTGLLAGLGEEIELDVSGLSFKTIEQGKDTASVQVTGKIQMFLLGQKQEEEIDEAVPVVKEDGKWRVCNQ